MQSPKKFCFILMILFHLFGCGQMGPLYLPEKDALLQEIDIHYRNYIFEK